MNSCSHSGMSEHNGLLRSIMVSFDFVSGNFWLAWESSWLVSRQTTGFTVLSSTLELDTSTGGESIPLWSSLSWVSLSLNTVVIGEVDEYWGRCRMITLLSWRCHWGWRMRTGGRTRWQAWYHNRNWSSPCYIVFENRFYWDVVFDRWSIHKNIRFHRKAFRVIRLLACPRGLS